MLQGQPPAVFSCFVPVVAGYNESMFELIGLWIGTALCLILPQLPWDRLLKRRARGDRLPKATIHKRG